jgi:hypothetical protein
MRLVTILEGVRCKHIDNYVWRSMASDIPVVMLGGDREPQ